MKTALYNPIKSEYKSIVGGAIMLTPVTYTVYISTDVEVEGVHFCVTPENHNTYNMLMKKVGEKNEYKVFSVTFTYLISGLNFYHFSFWDGEKTLYISKGLLGEAEITNYPLSWQETVTKESETPEWFKGKVLYQIFPDRFNKAGETHYQKSCVIHKKWNEKPLYKAVNGEIKNNDFFGGNFDGIIEKLDYLKSLSVSIIYLNPIFEAKSNHK